MPTASEKLNEKKAAVVDRMETDHENLHLSRDQFEAKYRKKKEIAAKLKLEQNRLEEEARKEEEELAKIGKEDQDTKAEE